MAKHGRDWHNAATHREDFNSGVIMPNDDDTLCKERVGATECGAVKQLTKRTACQDVGDVGEAALLPLLCTTFEYLQWMEGGKVTKTRWQKKNLCRIN